MEFFVVDPKDFTFVEWSTRIRAFLKEEKLKFTEEDGELYYQGDDIAAIQGATNELQKASHAMAEVLYKNTQAPGGDAPKGGDQGGATPADGDVVDAEFSESK